MIQKQRSTVTQNTKFPAVESDRNSRQGWFDHSRNYIFAQANIAGECDCRSSRLFLQMEPTFDEGNLAWVIYQGGDDELVNHEDGDFSVVRVEEPPHAHVVREKNAYEAKRSWETAAVAGRVYCELCPCKSWLRASRNRVRDFREHLRKQHVENTPSKRSKGKAY